MTVNVETLKESLDKLSFKPQVSTDEAIYAKDTLDKQRRSTVKEQEEQNEKRDQLLQEFNTSIQLLMKIFHVSKFDQLMGIAMNPLRMLVLNFALGMLRGLGFAIGVVIIIGLLATVFFDAIAYLFI